MKRLTVLEGLDGCGKSTQFERLLARLSDEGHPVRGITFPDYDDPSSALIKMYLRGEFGGADEVGAFAASAFYAVDRYASFVRRWRDDYEAGVPILAARYTTSNAIYQLAKLPREAWEDYLSWLEDFEYVRLGLPRPELVVFLDMPLEVSQALLTRRYEGEEGRRDVHERDWDFMRRCREAAHFAAGRQGWIVLDCAKEGAPRSIGEINDALYRIVSG